MSHTSDLDLQLQFIDDLEIQLKHELQQAEATLHRLLCNRESFIRSINRNKWDLAQYRLDDLQQSLADIGEELDDIAPVVSIIENLIAP
jgi:deoxyribodipyrimidine photolyase